MKRIQLLFDDEQNRYQKLLLEEAQAAAGEHGFEMLETRFAQGSTMRQIADCFGSVRADPGPDGVLVLMVEAGGMQNSVEALAKAGIDCVFLNRIPDYLDRLTKQFPETLFAAVAPDQTEIGRIQGRQCLRLLPEGGSVLLILGVDTSPSAVSRLDGFREAVGESIDIVHVVKGRWQADRAEQALADWLRFSAGRASEVDLIVSQNDLMARGARRALESFQARQGAAEVTRLPILGCDGLPGEGVEMVEAGELAATVVMPPTSRRAIDILAAYWSQGEVVREEKLLPTSLPPVEQLDRLPRRAGS